MSPGPQHYVDEWRDELLAEGEARARAADVIRILARREIQTTDEQRQRIQQCADPVMLDRWFDAALSVGSVDELFAQ